MPYLCAKFNEYYNNMTGLLIAVIALVVLGNLVLAMSLDRLNIKVRQLTEEIKKLLKEIDND